MPIALLKFPTDLLREVFRLCDPFELVHGHGDIIDAVRVTKDDGTIGWLKVELGIYASLEFLIADPSDTVVEEIPEEDDW
ncbi:hypothetical protein L3Y34_016203 [Caenorhabditis briggsae]|uniref:Uncharacterized protein n=1 Tax=Caenorhabditis briggsae TaxID=6238 RepID=A0AAE9J008_CAEBR|nr:hypothetical protein L3Y34_016203 [Caenorhabditis briggsae]